MRIFPVWMVLTAAVALTTPCVSHAVVELVASGAPDSKSRAFATGHTAVPPSATDPIEAALLASLASRPKPRVMTPVDFDAVVPHTLINSPIPEPALSAFCLGAVALCGAAWVRRSAVKAL